MLLEKSLSLKPIIKILVSQLSFPEEAHVMDLVLLRLEKYLVNVDDFSVDYNAIDKSNILNIQKCLMTKEQYEIIIRLIRQMLVGVLCSSWSLATTCSCH